MKINKLTSNEKSLIANKGMKALSTGEYLSLKEGGVYACRQCEAPLYKSMDEFDSRCGCPSFGQEIMGAVSKKLDMDGKRAELGCEICGAHLGHIFVGENFTDKDVLHRADSLSMKFISKSS